MSRYLSDKERCQRVRIAALTMAQRGPFTASELFRFLYPGRDPLFDHRARRHVRGLKKSLHKLVAAQDLSQHGESYALKHTARNGLVCAVLPVALPGSGIPAPTAAQLMGGSRRPVRLQLVYSKGVA